MEMEKYRAVMDTHALNLCSVFFGRLGAWFLNGSSLIEFCVNRRVVVDGIIHIGIYGIERDVLIRRFEQFDITLESDSNPIIAGTKFGIQYSITVFQDTRKSNVGFPGSAQIPKSWLFCDQELSDEIARKNRCLKGGMWSVPISEIEPIEFRLPFMVGSYLDVFFPGWISRITDRNPEAWHFTNVFFNGQRRTNAIELINQMYECGRKAGIDHAMFLGFGTALGAVRHGDFIPFDRDMDMCIIADWISQESALEYVRICKEAGLGEHRWVTPQCRSDGMPVWFSLGPKSPVSEEGIKSCNWFWFKHGGYWWHSKGGLWVSPTKFSKKKTQYTKDDEAIAKGIPLECIEKLVDFSFLGASIKLPDNIGRCLDSWYLGWPVPREGASSHQWVMVIEKWDDKNTWRIG